MKHLTSLEVGQGYLRVLNIRSAIAEMATFYFDRVVVGEQHILKLPVLPAQKLFFN